MEITSMYPVLITRDVARTADFYRSRLGFETTFASDWYVSLARGRWELAILEAGHPTLPQGFHDRTSAGVLINLEVDDVDALYAMLIADGLAPVLPLRSEDFGQRHAIFAGPDEVLIDIITPIPPTAGFAEQFSAAALDEALQGGHRE